MEPPTQKPTDNPESSKALFFFRKQLQSESLAEVQVVIDSCRLISQSNYFEQLQQG